MSKIRFDFTPDCSELNPHYIELEHCINAMNASNNRCEIDRLCQQAVHEVLTIADFNFKAIDMMGGGLS